MKNQVRWCVEEADSGLPVAQGCAPDRVTAIREMTHYAVQYAQDGPIRFWARQNRVTIAQGNMSPIKETITTIQ